jgi:hypothetical protein
LPYSCTGPPKSDSSLLLLRGHLDSDPAGVTSFDDILALLGTVACACLFLLLCTVGIAGEPASLPGLGLFDSIWGHVFWFLSDRVGRVSWLVGRALTIVKVVMDSKVGSDLKA